MDLHAWITQQVDDAETAALQNLTGHRLAIQPDDSHLPISGVITDASQTGGELHLTLAQYDIPPTAPESAPLDTARAALRRCEADRRILARHQQWAQSGYCEACDQDLTTNLNDCPELLDLAHAHGLTAETLTQLDRPRAPEPKTQPGPHVDHWLPVPPQTVTITANIPAALRGPNWKP